MTHSARQQSVQGGLEMVEEATQVLRAAPASALAAYYVGSLPFVLGLLYFWADMSRNPFARRHAVEESLGLALLFLWMKFWQVVFVRQIRAVLAVEPPASGSFARAVRIAITQAILQPWGLLLVPLALIAVLPFPAVYAFFQNVTALDDGEPAPLDALVKKSSRLATLWSRQNVVAQLVLWGFALVVFLNWMMVCYMLPGLGKTFLGIESVFTRSGFLLLNTTFLATMLGLTYLAVDPVAKTVFALRCFYGESRQSGEDLKARLKQFSLSAKVAAVALVLLLTGVNTSSAADTAPPVPPAAAPAVPPGDLDQSITKVISQNKYAWRLPREQADDSDDADEGVIAKFFDHIRTTLLNWRHAAWEWIKEMWEKFFPSAGPNSLGHTASMFSMVTPLQILIFTLIAVVASVLAVFLFRYWQNRRRSGATVHSIAIQPIPDLLDENVGADQLPEDGWTKLARELLARGDYRLALRAFYLAGLAHLAARNLISLAKFKSNRDYERELRRRGHAFPHVPPAFGEMVVIFERAWYGLHEVNGESVARFTQQAEKLKAAE